MPTTLVLGYDGSDCAKKALARTADLVGDMPGATVVVVYSYEFSIGYVPPGMTDSPLMMSAEYDDHLKLLEEIGTSTAESAADTLRKAGAAVDVVVADGRPVEVLLDTATDREADVIVVGSHGESTMSSALLGSTALKLLHHSHIPVLVVPRHAKE